jgi:hypothetical protein
MLTQQRKMEFLETMLLIYKCDGLRRGVLSRSVDPEILS